MKAGYAGPRVWTPGIAPVAVVYHEVQGDQQHAVEDRDAKPF